MIVITSLGLARPGNCLVNIPIAFPILAFSGSPSGIVDNIVRQTVAISAVDIASGRYELIIVSSF